MAKKQTGDTKQQARQVKGSTAKTQAKKYEPPKLTKFEKLEKLIVCGE